MTTKLLFGILATVSSTLALSSSLALVSAPASAFEVERGNHGANRIVTDQPSKTSQQEAQTTPRQAPLFVRGHHGAQQIVTQEGVGGPVGERDVKGAPDLDGTVHAQDGWF